MKAYSLLKPVVAGEKATTPSGELNEHPVSKLTPLCEKGMKANVGALLRLLKGRIVIIIILLLALLATALLTQPSKRYQVKTPPLLTVTGNDTFLLEEYIYSDWQNDKFYAWTRNTYKYDSLNRLSENFYYQTPFSETPSWQLSYKVKNFYNKNGYLDSISIFNPAKNNTWKLINSCYFVYDSINRISRYYGEFSQTTFLYNMEGFLSDSIEYYWKNNKWEFQEKLSYTYYPDGKLKTEQYHGSRESPEKWGWRRYLFYNDNNLLFKDSSIKNYDSMIYPSNVQYFKYDKYDRVTFIYNWEYILLKNKWLMSEKDSNFYNDEFLIIDHFNIEVPDSADTNGYARILRLTKYIDANNNIVKIIYQDGNKDSMFNTSLDEYKYKKSTVDVIDPNKQDKDFSEINLISPNPAGDFIYLNKGVQDLAPGEQIKIYNTYGECVMSLETGLRPVSTKIDVSGLPAGVYFVRCGGQTGRFVKW